MCGIVEYIGYREAHLHETVFATPVWGIYATLPVRRLSRFAPLSEGGRPQRQRKSKTDRQPGGTLKFAKAPLAAIVIFRTRGVGSFGGETKLFVAGLSDLLSAARSR